MITIMLIIKYGTWINCYLTQKMNLLHGWRPEYFEQSTFLTNAVISGKEDIVALLLFHGANPEQICPQRGSFCAFDEAFIFQISEAIPSRRNSFFNIINDYLHGYDADAFSIVDFD